jgi:hypothetical protein
VFGSAALVVLAAIFWTSCGGGSSSTGTNTKPLTNIKHRLFVSNTQAGDVQIVDVDKDELAGFETGKTTLYNIITGGSPEFMDSTSDNKNIAVYGASSFSISVINSDTENVTTTVYLGGPSDSIRITSDAKYVYAAVRNRVNGTGIANGAVQVMDVTNGNIPSNYPVPDARWIALSHDNKTLLVFPDDPSNTPYLIDLTATSPAASPIPGTFDRPIAAYFSSDDSKAYILNCGPECGGAQASVTELTLSTLAQRTVPVPAATVGVLDGTNLYVAGQTASSGMASVVDTGAMTVTSSAAIGNGFHRVMRSQSGKVWIGATSCGGGGCLSVFDPSSGNVVIDNPAAGSTSKGDVTGMDFESSNNEMYVCEGGELNPYDTSGNPVHTNVDIVGQAWDVRAVPPISK